MAPPDWRYGAFSAPTEEAKTRFKYDCQLSLSIKNALKSSWVKIAIFYISQVRVFNFLMAPLIWILRHFSAILAHFLLTKKLYWPYLSFATFRKKIGPCIMICLIFKTHGHELCNTVYVERTVNVRR